MIHVLVVQLDMPGTWHQHKHTQAVKWTWAAGPPAPWLLTAALCSLHLQSQLTYWFTVS